ncbi:hsp70 nucleotide exchange factor fes1 [Apophysomyces sp. BC1034]|nr:hsp70 nucleotide exchange factor fes1 [Apophysomyces sp. BC1015]KAG0183030.1 hsp70 nucleotide exchange factor fes1 [Apophysomyces sp. BC1021]KAG0194842.1 hsp70 nucleotide exchange factor fes1 [Apophysomyces sp. BC1034]
MEKLLQWAVDNSDTGELQRTAEAIRRGEQVPDPTRYNPAVLEAILGKDDATRMKEAVQCIVDPEDSVENKEIALDNFELLVEGIDNAKNIENMKLWPDLISQLTAKEAAVRKGVAWVCGTAVQNNPDAQKALLRNNGLEPLVTLLKQEENKEVRAKVQYAISGFLKHFPEGVEAFKKLDGFRVLADIIKNADDTPILRKVVFTFNSLMLENSTLASDLIEMGILEDLQAVIIKYTQQEEDEDMVEKALRTLHTLVTQTKTTVPEQLKKYIVEARDKYGADNLGLDRPEWDDLLA